MLSSIIPILINFFSQIDLTCFDIDHWMINLTGEIDFRRTTRKMIKRDFEFKFGVFKQTISNEDYSMPNYHNKT